ncbi:MAG: Ig-like domain-containing protein [Planctomycetes bacterium]|nr:Ig-like domain-containing protein [Planctomycetota bacterium]
MFLRRRTPALVLVPLLAAACSRSESRPEAFEVARTSPPLGAGAAPLLLNDSITIYFTAPVQPPSVTEDSVTVLDDQGRKVPGSLRVGVDWVTFEPEPPLAADLADGSFRPGATYRLLVAGSPRPDAVRAADGRRLAAPSVWTLRIAEPAELPPGVPSALRPLAFDVPLLLRATELPQPLPVDAARLRLHFTLPLLPTSVSADAITVRLLRNLEVLRPRSLRIVTSRLDPFPGCTLEVDLGSQPQVAGGGHVVLRPGDCISVELNVGSGALTDYAAQPVLLGPAQWWNVVEGGSIALAEWPSGEIAYLGADPLLPGFEVRAGVIRPRVRIEAGDGRLGLFRPRRDTQLRPGQPFDPGDGRWVASEGSDFPFTAVDIPAGVTVTLDATDAPVRVLACGGIRVAGDLVLRGSPGPLRLRRFEAPAVDLLGEARIALLAAGDLQMQGRIRAEWPLSADGSPLTLLSAGRVQIGQELPFHTVLALEAPPPEQSVPVILGARGQALVTSATFTYGVPAGSDLQVTGLTPWRQLPPDRDSGFVRLVDASPGLAAAWQAAAPDALAPQQPDPRLARQSRPHPIQDGDLVTIGAGSFLRVELSARVQGGAPIPTVRELRLLDR